LPTPEKNLQNKQNVQLHFPMRQVSLEQYNCKVHPFGFKMCIGLASAKNLPISAQRKWQLLTNNACFDLLIT
jgi:hypothetical protein